MSNPVSLRHPPARHQAHTVEILRRTPCAPPCALPSEAIQDTESVLKSMRAEHDPLAAHIFVSRREYRNTSDTKSGKRTENVARFTWQTACDLGFRGSLAEWEQLLGAAPRR